MKVRFLKPAQFEVDAAVEWYAAQSAGLETRFLDDLDMAIRRVVAYPFSCAQVEQGLRRCLFSRFPYGIIYGIDSDIIIPDFPLENFQGLKTGTNLTGKSKFFDWFHMPSNHSR
jgi:hypothetical protein